MTERLLFVVVVAAAAYAAYRLFAALHARRANRAAHSDPLLAAVRPGVPVIVCFTTPTCVPCRTIQQPALEQVKTRLGDSVEVVHIDATEHADAAERWGVFSVPTSFIVDGEGHTRAVNHGVASAETLLRQLGAAA